MENPFFKHTLKYPPGLKFYQILEVGRTQESEHPWREGVSLVLRLHPLTTGYVVGVWLHTRDESAFHEAAGARLTDIPAKKMREW